MALKKLEELGFKPKKGAEAEKLKNETTDILKGIESDETKKLVLDLLFEALSQEDPKEILVYGMYVKKHLCPDISSKQKDKIEQTLKQLAEIIGK
ncbi:MAG: hypothetical protein WC325_01545 [Candidatus Bathyarchaeia archaeon]|jgi:hypothetical protein